MVLVAFAGCPQLVDGGSGEPNRFARAVGPQQETAVQPMAANGDQRVLADHEPAPIPINLVHSAGRYLSPTVRLFIDAAVPELRVKFRTAKATQKSA
jgi:DNA-binding transcriptional LysR family regulator